MSDKQLVPVKPVLPLLNQDSKTMPIPLVTYEKIDQTHYEFTYQFDDEISFKMEESDRSGAATDFIDVEFDSNIPNSHRVYYAVAAASGVLTGTLSRFHLSEEKLKNIKESKKKDWQSIIIKVAGIMGCKKNNYKDASKYLVDRAVKIIELNDTAKEAFVVLSQHPSLTGLFFSLVAQFSGESVLISEEGDIKYQELPKNYVVGDTNDEKIICAILYWFFSLAADKVASKRNIIDELGISKNIINIIKEFVNLPFFESMFSDYQNAENEFSQWLGKTIKDVSSSKDENNEEELNESWLKRMQATLDITENSFPVLINQCVIHSLYVLIRICSIAKEQQIDTFDKFKEIPSKEFLPSNDRIISKMNLIGSATFVAVNITGAVLKAIEEEKVNGRSFSETLLTELNLAGIGSFVFACAKDSKYWGEDIRVIFQRKGKAENNDSETDLEESVEGDAFTPLTLDVIQTRMLYSLESISVQYDICHSKELEIKETKEKWLSNWKKNILECADVPEEYYDRYFVEDEDIIYEGIFQLAKDKNNWGWFYLLAQEMALFKPYCPLGVDDDKEYKKLKLESNYVTDQFVRRQTIVSQSEIDTIVKAYSKYKGYISGSTQNKIIGVGVTAVAAVVTGGMALTFAPGIAAVIAGEAVAGLHGAALTSASLAFIGGGSIAAGGLGMAGGAAIITGGGALLGLASSGMTTTVAVILQTPSKYWVRQTAKLLTYSDCILSQNLNDKESVRSILHLVEKTIRNTDEKLQEIDEEKNDLDKELIKKLSEYIKYLKRCRLELQKIIKE